MSAETEGPNKPALLKFLGVLLVAIGIFFAGPSIYEIRTAQQARDWTPRLARVTYADVAQFGGGRADSIPLQDIEMQGVFLDTGEAFAVERMAFGEFRDADKIRQLVNEFRPGSEITVYSAPDVPDRVVLFNEPDVKSMYLLIVLGGACALFGAFSFLKGRNAGR